MDSDPTPQPCGSLTEENTKRQRKFEILLRSSESGTFAVEGLECGCRPAGGLLSPHVNSPHHQEHLIALFFSCGTTARILLLSNTDRKPNRRDATVAGWRAAIDSFSHGFPKWCRPCQISGQNRSKQVRLVLTGSDWFRFKPV